ncbi:probable WRKY transcription factor 25 [Impatiens glandulifera]|uniref:probable WRKY transcription factor 25 n=1 Tax=Impatiens glandulifera TaxID=253017 RepID=UPI001FB19DE0|nr:probable WRKY transcription factor 25 [Impatiens glandulifera]
MSTSRTPFSDQQAAVNDNIPATTLPVDPNSTSIVTSSDISNNHNVHQQGGFMSDAKEKDGDEYNWKRCGTRILKGSSTRKEYYNCSNYPQCGSKKHIEKDENGNIIQIVFKGQHEHPKPNKLTSSSFQGHVDHSYIGQEGPLDRTNPIISVVAHYQDQSSWDDVSDEEEPDDSRNMEEEDGGDINNEQREEQREEHREHGEEQGEEQREPKVVIEVLSDTCIVKDGYKWRKYGQKTVKGHTYPRHYYKCTSSNCCVKKQVERSSKDIGNVIVSYEGKHIHELPDQ